MKNLMTHVDIPAFDAPITYQSRLLLLGSCFAGHIGDALLQRRFKATVNPFGAVYNPLSLARSLRRLQSAAPFTDDEVIESDTLFTTFFHHSSFSHPQRDTFLAQANDALQKGAKAFAAADVVILTLGTARVYYDKQTRQAVNNCHKLPADRFRQALLTVDETVDALWTLIEPSRSRWILTVSPIRHWKDGAHHNQLSKAALLLAVEKLQQLSAKVSYFPAYELMMDELRDYRFYAEDMLHPSPQAARYIWERFAEAALSEETKRTMREAEKIIAAQNHRPLHPDSAASRQFQEKLAQQIAAFNTRHHNEQ
jgi:lysophospholipase L1-like esterase